VAGKKGKSGRKTRYNKTMPIAAQFIARAGVIDKDIAKILGIAESTLHKWKQDHPEFAKAIKKGKEEPDDKVVSALYQRALGYEHAEDKIFQFEGMPVVVPTIKHYAPSTTACIFWLKNRRPEEWRDVQEVLNTYDDTVKELAKAIKNI